MICKIQSCIFAALSLNFPFLFAATSPSCSTLMHMHPGSCKNSSPVESKMVCVLAMLCKLIQLFMVVWLVLWHSHLGSSVMYYCLVRVTSQSVIVISNGLPYFLAIFWFSSFHVRL
uniref:Uncharacterized protein n=1 Tax=Setaria viridis TaxID=4556 RepID=A0A4U6W762_SETVI|nr:hypothetical protein SEVIR_1G036200v2 [Setaria viridis]